MQPWQAWKDSIAVRLFLVAELSASKMVSLLIVSIISTHVMICIGLTCVCESAKFAKILDKVIITLYMFEHL